jgi:hypothetical protein
MRISLANKTLALCCEQDGSGLLLEDRQRQVNWRLDEQSLVYGTGGEPQQCKPLQPVAARVVGENLLIVVLRAGEGELEMRWHLRTDHIELRLPPPAADDIRCVALPGSFTPENEPVKLLLPIMQGMLWDGRGEPFEVIHGESGHTGFSMPFVGHLAVRGGLLAIAETRDDVQWWLGKSEQGRCWATGMQIDSLGTMRYERVARIFPTDTDVVGIAARYRRYVQDSGRFISWEEKLAERPTLERLFGALFCFVGYCQDDLDYVAECARLKAYGFDRALVYPARFNTHGGDIQMGGRPAIDLPPDVVAGIVALGFDVAPWSWLNEALDDGSHRIRNLLRRNAQGEALKHWAIDDQQWYHVCASCVEAHQRRALREGLADMTWDHFDVLACVPPMECQALDHAHHPGQPLSRSDARDGIRRTFLADRECGLPVSSEGFNDAYSLEYDIGSVKAWPQYGPWPFWPVPLTSLVYHDSLLHSWWEVHNYNSHYFSRTRAGDALFEYGGGRPRLMAALDALMGAPPDLFPFGAQYGWTGRRKETFLYRFRFDDPEVQLALRQALPVAQLHRRTGPQAMVHFRILSEDGYVQESAFADGTHVVANFSRDVRGEDETGGRGPLMPESWQQIA